jgi:hypothetical protein
MAAPFPPVPRAWELHPETSALYQLMAENGDFTESVRKGLAQTLGRYTTSIKEPVGYAMPALKLAKIFDYAKAVATDDHRRTWTKGFPGFDPLADEHSVGAREVLCRECLT